MYVAIHDLCIRPEYNFLPHTSYKTGLRLRSEGGYGPHRWTEDKKGRSGTLVVVDSALAVHDLAVAEIMLW
jgi:hypothetical protein